jgi:prolipoprotein diacylglyceryl transferase
MVGTMGALSASLICRLGPIASIGWHVKDRFHLFHVGAREMAISPHGVGIAVGYLAGAYLLSREGPKRGLSEQVINSIVLWGLIGAVVGARVGYVLSHLSEFHNPVDVLAVYKGGISLVGGIVGWVVATIPILRRARHSVLNAFDAAALPLAVGIVVGRIGDLIIGDHLGTPTNFPLAFRYWGGNLSGYDCSSLPGTCTTLLSHGRAQVINHAGAKLFDTNNHLLAQGIGVNQTALYDWMSAIGLTLVLLFLLRRSRRVGVLTCTFVIWYAGVRIVTDFLRVENRFLGLTGSQWTSVAVVGLCVGILLWVRRGPAPPSADQPGPRQASAASPG